MLTFQPPKIDPLVKPVTSSLQHLDSCSTSVEDLRRQDAEQGVRRRGEGLGVTPNPVRKRSLGVANEPAATICLASAVRGQLNTQRLIQLSATLLSVYHLGVVLFVDMLNKPTSDSPPYSPFQPTAEVVREFTAREAHCAAPRIGAVR